MQNRQVAAQHEVLSLQLLDIQVRIWCFVQRQHVYWN